MALDLGLLFLRVTTGLMMASHGYGKAMDFLAGRTGFPDPLGIGSTLSLGLAAGAELVCALLVVLGVKTRFTAIPVVITMLVAAFVHHANDPWGQKEHALLFAVVFLTLVFTGAGRFSVDGLLEGRRRRP